jgi:uncharacterized protein DUF3617
MRIRQLITTAALLALAACGSPNKADGNASSASLSSDQKFDPGQWEMTMEMVNVSAPNLPPAVLSAMKSQPKVTTRNCMTPEEARGPSGDMFTGKKDGNCTHEGFSLAGGRMRGSTTCTDPNGNKTTMTMDGQYQPRSFNVTMKMDTNAGGQAMAIESRMTGRRVGECEAGKGG